MTAGIKDTPSVLEVKPKVGIALRISNTISNPKVVAVILRLREMRWVDPLYSVEERRALLGYSDRRSTPPRAKPPSK